MFLYNTLSGKKEELTKPIGRPLKMFVCGPTVYDYPHIGNGRTFVSFDAFAKYLKSKGWKVFYLQNITDIDDKIIKKSKEEKISWKDVSRKFERIYHDDEKLLGIDSVTRYARATDHIKEIVTQTETLMNKGYAYEIKGDGVYFDVSKFKDYGKLSKRTYLDAEDSVSRIDDSVNKRNKGDFVLWKFSKPGEPSWKTALGEGRPGWHIEDTAISEKYFGPQYDLHGGGIDLKFPHHEAEIAQEESSSGKSPFVKIWMHSGHLLVNGRKMSKSLGNFMTMKNFLEKNSGDVFRLMVLSHHYRSPMNYTEELVKNSGSNLKSIRIFLEKLDFVARRAKDGKSPEKNFGETLSLTTLKIQKALDDDFNTPEMLGILFSLINSFERSVWNLTKNEAQALKKVVNTPLSSLGLEIRPEKIPLKMRGLTKKRELFRLNKQFIQSDDLRNKAKDIGYSIDDTPLGPFVYKS